MMSINPNRRIEEAMPGEETYYNSSSYAQPPPQQAPQVVPIPVSTSPMPQQPTYQPPPQDMRVRNAEAEEEERRIRERTEARERAQQAQAQAKGAVGPMKVKENYVPRAQQEPHRRLRWHYVLIANSKFHSTSSKSI